MRPTDCIAQHSKKWACSDLVLWAAEYVLRSPIAVISGLEEDEYDLDRWHKLGEIMSKRLKQPSFEDATEQQRYQLLFCEKVSKVALLAVLHVG